MLMSWQSSVHVILMQYYSSYFNVRTYTQVKGLVIWECVCMCDGISVRNSKNVCFVQGFFCSDSAIFFLLCMKFLKTFLWYSKLTEYVRSYRIFKSFNYSRVKLTSIFCITECSKFQITYQCTQKKWHAHKAFTNAMDNILVMAINRRRKKNSKQLKEIVKVGKLITLIDRQQCSGIHTKIWIFVTPSKMQPSRTIDCHFILCSYISFFIVHLILFHFFAGKLLSSWAFKFVVVVKHKKKKTVVVFRGFFLHFFFCICIRI